MIIWGTQFLKISHIVPLREMHVIKDNTIHVPMIHILIYIISNNTCMV